MAKGNKQAHPPMVMKRSDVTMRNRLLAMWDYQCVLCGHGFQDISSVTFEHLVPRSLGGKKASKAKKKRCGDNFGPTHFNCNQFRQNFSLCRTMRLLDRQRKRLGEDGFNRWINKAVPHRVISPELMALGRVSKPDLGDMMFAVFGIALPDWVPGM